MTIKQIQCLLLYLGYNPGVIDGVTGPNTQTAVTAFQKQEGLEVDGKPGPKTQTALLDAVANGRVRKEAVAENATTTDPEDKTTGTFWDDIPNFTRQEFACPCPRCGGFPAEPAEKLVRAAQALRDQTGKPITISSGVRCQAHNDELKGSVPNSRHIIGHAMDFCVRGMSAAQVLPLAKALPGIVYAYAIDGSYVHMDIGN